MSRDKDEFVTLRIQAKLLERIRVLAAANERTVAGEMRLALREHLDRAEEEAEVNA